MDEKLQTLLIAVDASLKAFGAPGDYGYSTKEGAALYALYKARAAFSSSSNNPDDLPDRAIRELIAEEMDKTGAHASASLFRSDVALTEQGTAIVAAVRRAAITKATGGEQ